MGRTLGQSTSLKFLKGYAQKNQKVEQPEQLEIVVDYLYQIIMRKGTTEQAMPLLFNVGIQCKTPIGNRLKASGLDCSFIYGDEDWVRLVDEDWSKNVSEKFYLVKSSGHNMHMENPEELAKIMIDCLNE